MSEDGLRKHLLKAEPHATAYQNKIARVQHEYVPPYNPLVGGWDTNFGPKREGQAYYPFPLVWATVNIYASLMGMRPPRFQMEPRTSDEGDRVDAANVELLIKYEQQRQSMKEVHLDLAKVLSLKGRAGVKVGYEGKDLWTENIDNIENLWAAFADDSYRRVNSWTYHSLVDREVAKELGWRDESPGTGGGFWQWARQKFANSGKADPLGRWAQKFWGVDSGSDRPDFDGLPMIDFHFKEDGKVVNEIWIGSQQVDRQVLRMDEFPYIVVNSETEPGNPFGIGDAEPILVLQREIASLKTKWHEAIRRNGLDAWIARNLKGLNPIDLEGGGRYFMLQGNKDEQNIEPLKFPIDDVGYRMALQELWEDFRRLTGIPPEVMGGGDIAAGTSGYAMAVKFQSVITRLGPRQTRLSSFYQTWVRLTLKNMQIVDPDSKAVIKDNYFVNVDWENITPKDLAQQISSLATAVSAGLMSHRSAMEDLGLVAEDEEAYIEEWNRNMALNPAAAAQIQAAEGALQAAQAGNPAAVAAEQAEIANAGMPDMAGENQFTQNRIPSDRPNVVASNPVMSSPPGA